MRPRTFGDLQTDPIRVQAGPARILRGAPPAPQMQCETRPRRPFGIGDVVCLKSGGEPGTVTQTRCLDGVEVTFGKIGRDLDGNMSLVIHTLPADCLKLSIDPAENIPF